MTEPTGERFVPESMGGQLIEAEHVARYALAAQLVRGQRVLDAGCGVGWGTALLLEAGASSAAGLDIDASAIADAQRRVPTAQFMQGDLADLPWPDGVFDVVVCFEALEHVETQDETINELTRVLAPDGLLLVSSPDPRVYPAGNPFHVRELTPEELVDMVSKRLPNLTLIKQHTQIASILVSAEDLFPGANHEVLGRVVSKLESGSDPYSLVIAGRGAIPRVLPVMTSAPADQLLHLEAFGKLLADERALMDEDQRRVVKEREMILAERQDLLRRLADAEDALQVHADSTISVQSTISRLTNEVSLLQNEREALRREREHTAMLLLESEQRLAIALASESPEGSIEPVFMFETSPSGAELADDLGQLQAERDIERELARDLRLALDRQAETIHLLNRELDSFRTSTSWRLTAPFRALRTLWSRRSA